MDEKPLKFQGFVRNVQRSGSSRALLRPLETRPDTAPAVHRPRRSLPPAGHQQGTEPADTPRPYRWWGQRGGRTDSSWNRLGLHAGPRALCSLSRAMLPFTRYAPIHGGAPRPAATRPQGMGGTHPLALLGFPTLHRADSHGVAGTAGHTSTGPKGD